MSERNLESILQERRCDINYYYCSYIIFSLGFFVCFLQVIDRRMFPIIVTTTYIYRFSTKFTYAILGHIFIFNDDMINKICMFIVPSWVNALSFTMSINRLDFFLIVFCFRIVCIFVMLFVKKAYFLFKYVNYVEYGYDWYFMLN